MIGRGGKVVEKPTRDANGRIVKKDGKPVMRPVMRPGAPYEANRCLEVLKRAFNLAVVWGFLPDDHRNPCVGIQRFKETKRDRWVTHEELPALAKAIDAEEDVFIKAALWLYLFTGCRRAELLSAKWEQVNFDRRELRLPETKSGRAFTLPLSAPAVAILDNLPQVEGCPYVFPAKFGKTGHLVNIDKPWRRIRAAAGVPDCRLHDLRRTVGSWLAMDGASLLLIGKTLNQTSPAATAVYSRLSEDPVRAALERHAEKLVKIATGKPGAEIVELPRKAGKK
jgi:integrase